MVAAALFATTSCAQKASSVEVSFNYEHQDGPGSNQYAVWVENAQGKVVRTLFVTSFTTKGREEHVAMRNLFVDTPSALLAFLIGLRQ